MKRDINKTVANLQDEQASLAEVRFASLSDLTREEQAAFAAGWARIPLDKRQKLLAVLDELASDDFRMDFSALFRIALTDRDAEVRRLAVEGLWMDENPSVIRPLLTLLAEDDSADVRASAADALGNWVLMGEYEQISGERASEIVEALVHILANTGETLMVRARALESLGYSHDERVPAMIERVYKAPDPQARRSALKAMGRHGDERWTATVRRELSSEEPSFRFEAVRAVGEMADRGATGRIIALVQDNDREVREMAIWALGEVGGKQAEGALRRLAQGEDATMRKLAREALTELKMLEEADDMAGLTLFDFDGNDDLLEDQELELDDEYRSVVIDPDWEEELEEGYHLADDDDIEFESDEEDGEDEWMSDAYADLRAEMEYIASLGGEDDDEDLFADFEDDEEEEPDLSFLDDEEDEKE